MAHACRARRLVVLLAFLCAAPAAGDTRAKTAGSEAGAADPVSREVGSEHREYQIKAAFLLNFIRYTTWPPEAFANPKAPIEVTVVGRDPFGPILEETFAGETIEGRRIVVRRERGLPEALTGHVVFSADLEHVGRAELLRACRRRPMLLVGESPDFAAEGACVNFYLADKKTRFEINTDSLAEAKLVISPAVLKLARIVKGRREESR
ncbi:MAG TPA: YfiR family protein [Planctomycetota bacterium]